MSFTEINKMYGTKWKKETRVSINGESGIIVGTRGMALKVHMDSEKKPRICHPIRDIKIEEKTTPVIKSTIKKKGPQK